MHFKSKALKAIKCLHPQCQRGTATRGLCRAHYAYASWLVRNGKTTWKELVAHGKATEKVKHHRVTSWLLDFKEKEGQ